MDKEKKQSMDRRKFLGLSALGLTGLTILPSYTINGMRIAPSDRVVMGFIGLGRQGLNDFRGFSSVPGVQVAACCDVDSIKQKRFKKIVEDWQKESGMVERCDTYERYEEILERTDIDAVEVVTPDHWHALQTIHACKAGKDVYVQKPLSFTIQEALKMEEVAKKTRRVVQVGSQQRSSAEFKKAIELVQNGSIGHIEKVYAKVGDPPAPYNLEKMTVPGNLNWNLWLGPLNDSNIHYHPDLCPPISLDPPEDEQLWGAWRWYRETGNGYTADWGAHMFDIAQWAMGMDQSGPVEFIPPEKAAKRGMQMKYENGVIMNHKDWGDFNAVQFLGSEGKIEVSRNFYRSDINGLTKLELKDSDTPLYRSENHYQDWVDAIKKRSLPVSDVETGHRTAALCNIVNIGYTLERSLKWKPAEERFIDDDDANSMLTRPFRGSWDFHDF